MAAEGAGFDDEIVVVAPAPGAATRLQADTLPFTVKSADADAFRRAQASDLTDYLGTHLGSICRYQHWHLERLCAGFF